eukprot:2206321-Pleurochrysis_carterae.AAC.5
MNFQISRAATAKLGCSSLNQEQVFEETCQVSMEFSGVRVQEEKLCQPVVWVLIIAAMMPFKHVLPQNDDF